MLTLLLTGCQFSKSVKKDFLTGLSSKGESLTCDDIFLTVNNEKISRNTFIFGETFYLHYNDIKGFTVDNGNVFPSMSMTVTSESGDTLLHSDDLYSGNTGGVNYSPLELSAHLTVASPLRSGNSYTLFIKIRDKKGDGCYSSAFKFSLERNKMIQINASGTKHDEIYIYSEGDDKVITDGKIKYDDNIYIFVEGIKGFKEENGLVFPILSMKGTDSGNNQILDFEDLFAEYSESGIAVTDFSSRVSAHFRITGSGFANPLHLEMNVSDRKGDSYIRVTTDMELQ